MFCADVCAGVDVTCLNEDIASETDGSSCRPLDEGSFCGVSMLCNKGICVGGEQHWEVDPQSAATAHAESSAASAHGQE